jgi:hypothetical protein
MIGMEQFLADIPGADNLVSNVRMSAFGTTLKTSSRANVVRYQGIFCRSACWITFADQASR